MRTNVDTCNAGINSAETVRCVDNAVYDVAGRVTTMSFPAGGNGARTQTSYGWTTAG